MRAIAEAAHVSHVTVSLALRNHPSIPEATRERIRKLANAMGYRPDPALSALNIYRNARRRIHYQSTLAWINVHPNKNTIQAIPEYHSYFLGALRRAEEAGYQLEEFWFHEAGMTSLRLSQILRARNISGILLAPKLNSPSKLELQWEFFSIVTFGFSHGTTFHLVTGTQYRNARLAVRRMHGLGYRRIAAFVSDRFERQTDRNISSGMYAECAELKCCFLILKIPENPTPAQQQKAIAWLKTNKPEVILAHNLDIFDLLKKAGLNVPEDIAVGIMSTDPARSHLAGIDTNPEQVGVVAVDQLIALIHRNERGLPVSPLEILVGGDWRDGTSVPQR